MGVADSARALSSDELVDLYLARLGLAGRPAPTLGALDDLIGRHIERVPFENLDVFERLPIVLGTRSALEKVVVRRRGGFCFELNEAFRALLEVLGFLVRRIEGRVWREAAGRFGPAFDHLALVVTLDGVEYLADVGFGDNNRGAMALPDGGRSDISGTYRLRPATTGTDLVLERLTSAGGGSRPLYEMTLAPQPLAAFEPLCAYHQSAADSIFMKGLICTRATPTGRISLTEQKLTVHEDGRKTVRPVTDERMLAQLLAEHFAITR